MALLNIKPDHGHLLPIADVTEMSRTVENELVHNVVVHRFKVGDVEDPDLWAAESLYNWEQSDAGQWIMKNALETPEWRRQLDYNTYGHQYAIIAKLGDRALVYWKLRWA